MSDTLIDKVKSLPPEQQAEVEDFVDFLKTRKDRGRDEAAERLSDAFRRLDALGLPELNPEEIEGEIDATRTERRARYADRR